MARDPADADRVRKARVPPGYTDACVNADRTHRLYWTARDKAGRLQYRYTPEWRAGAHARKYGRLAAIGRALGEIRARVARELREAPGPAATKVCGRSPRSSGSSTAAACAPARGATCGAPGPAHTTVDETHLRRKGAGSSGPPSPGVRRACDVADRTSRARSRAPSGA